MTYGEYDVHRLVQTIRILPRHDKDSEEPALGVEAGGLESAEAMMLARYFMYKQVYFHPIRRIYDIHLKEFLKDWLPLGRFSTDVNEHLAITDNEVLTALRAIYRKPEHPAHASARHILDRQHFKLLYQRNPIDHRRNQKAAEAIYKAACGEFGSASLRLDPYDKAEESPDFPVLGRDNRIVSSLSASTPLAQLPSLALDFVFAHREISLKAQKWLEESREAIVGFG